MWGWAEVIVVTEMQLQAHSTVCSYRKAGGTVTGRQVEQLQHPGQLEARVSSAFRGEARSDGDNVS